MSSTQQTALTIVGAGVGFFALGGNPMGAMYGAQIGYSLGMSSLSTTLPPSEGPRVGDLTTQTAAYGTSIPKSWGTVGHAGVVIWSAPINETKTTVTQDMGGKGGPTQTQSNTTYSYDASFAVMFHDGPVKAVRRIWANEYLLLDNGDIDDYGTLSASETADWALTKAVGLKGGEGEITLYYGSESQEPDPTIQSYEGAANTPAFRGYSYVVFSELLLERFGNRLPQSVRIEYVAVDESADTNANQVAVFDISGLNGMDTIINNQLVTVDDDLTAHMFIGTWPNTYSGSTMSYYKIFPTGDIAYIKSFQMDNSSPGVSADTEWNRHTSAACCEFPTIFGFTELRTSLKMFQPEGALDKAGGLFSWELPLDGLSPTVNHATRSFYQVGNIESGNIAFWEDESANGNTIRIYSYNKYIVVSLLGSSATNASIGYTDVTVATGTKIGIALTDNYLYVAYSDGSIRQYNHGGTLLDTWSKSPALSLTKTNAYGIYVDPRIETTVYLYAGVNLYRITDGVYEDLSSSFTEMADSGHTYFYKRGLVVYNSDTTYEKIRIDTVGNIAKKAESLDVVVGDLCEEAGLLSSEYDVTSLSGISVDGFTKTRVSAPSKSIEALMTAYQFSAYEDSHKLIFKLRGGAVDKTISANDLAAGIDTASADILPYSRADDQNLPRIVNVSYLDILREYDVNAQASIRSDIYDTQQKLDIQLPLVMDADTARQVAEKVHSAIWTARVDYKNIRLPLQHADIVPTDLITVTVDVITHTIRVTSVNIGEFVELTGIAENDADYTSSITGYEVNNGYEGSGYPGQSRVYFLDIPPIRNQDTDIGFYFAAYGYMDSWRGVTLWGRTTTGGYSNAATILNEATAGIVQNELASADPYIMDRGNSLTVQLSSGSVSSVTASELLSATSVNAAAVGAPGRWEILQFQTVSDNGDGTYTLSNLIRGQAGTEWAMYVHEENDFFIVLSSDSIDRVYNDEINTQSFYKHVSLGLPFGYGIDASFVNTGESLKPFAPVHVKYKDNSDGTFTISWTRRARVNYEWKDLIDVPQVEAQEKYKVSYLNGVLSSVENVTILEEIVEGETEVTIETFPGGVIYVQQYSETYGYGEYSSWNDLEYVYLEGNIYNDKAEDLFRFFTFEPRQFVIDTIGDPDIIVDLDPDENVPIILNRANLQWQEGTPAYNPFNGGIRYEGHSPDFVEGHFTIAADFSANPSGSGAAVAYLSGVGFDFVGDNGPVTGSSISFWFEPDGVKSLCFIGGITNEYLLFTTTGTEGVLFWRGSSLGTVPFTLPTSGWHHLVLVREGLAARAYLDGELAGEVELSSTTGININYIGTNGTGTSTAHSTWKYERMRFFTKPLTEIEAKALYNETIS